MRNEKYLYLVIAEYYSEERTSVAIPYCQRCANAWWARRIWLPSVITSGVLGLVLLLYLVAVDSFTAAAVVAVAFVAAVLLLPWSAKRSYRRDPGGGIEDWNLFRYRDQPQIEALIMAGWYEKR